MIQYKLGQMEICIQLEGVCDEILRKGVVQEDLGVIEAIGRREYVPLRNIKILAKYLPRGTLLKHLKGSELRTIAKPEKYSSNPEFKKYLENMERGLLRRSWMSSNQAQNTLNLQETSKEVSAAVSLGWHILTAMATGFVVPFVSLRASLGECSSLPLAAGALGLILVMIVEVVLVISRAEKMMIQKKKR